MTKNSFVYDTWTFLTVVVIVYTVLLKKFYSHTSVWLTIIVVNILVYILIVLLVVYILYYYYFTVIFSKTYFFCDTWVFLTLLVDYSCNPTWSIHTLVRFIYYYSLCCYCLYSNYFLYNFEKLTFFVTLQLF